MYWPQYLAPWINNIVPGNAQDFMHVVGVVEILAGLLVAFAPRIGAFVVAGWLFGIVVNLLTNNAPHYYDIALRDFGLMLAALTLARLASRWYQYTRSTHSSFATDAAPEPGGWLRPTRRGRTRVRCETR